MTVWTDNAARFATRRGDVNERIRIILTRLDYELTHAQVRAFRHGPRLGHLAQVRALDAAAADLAPIARASGRAGERTFEISWRSA